MKRLGELVIILLGMILLGMISVGFPIYCLYLKDVRNNQLHEKMIKTIAVLTDCKPVEAKRIWRAIDQEEEDYQDLGAKFVKDIYEKQKFEFELCDCKMIWNAMLVSSKINQDGFELMNIETPWMNLND